MYFRTSSMSRFDSAAPTVDREANEIRDRRRAWLVAEEAPIENCGEGTVSIISWPSSYGSRLERGRWKVAGPVSRARDVVDGPEDPNVTGTSVRLVPESKLNRGRKRRSR